METIPQGVTVWSLIELVETALKRAPSVTYDAGDFFTKMGCTDAGLSRWMASKTARAIAETCPGIWATAETFVRPDTGACLIYMIFAHSKDHWARASAELEQTVIRECEVSAEVNPHIVFEHIYGVDGKKTH